MSTRTQGPRFYRVTKSARTTVGTIQSLLAEYGAHVPGTGVVAELEPGP